MTHQQDERGDPLTRTHDPARKNYAAQETRQGRLGKPMLKVLGISLALAVLVWGGVEIWGERVDPTVDTEQTSSTSNGTSTQDTIDNTVPGGSETVPTERDPTSQSGSGGDSQSITPDGTAN
ncbi:hypothetical protein GB927_011110 [Shinella sp. CPCC 100929]|uniref:Uncharacterized protein n=1 Tax=Shinella lacus TaxID=2654216 RepID=A0ABT1R5Y9_9HYPH|nr:hypothetical protein [Shinella lacus]MCQ4630591.1 hypothetical protein [Shinella lacus]